MRTPPLSLALLVVTAALAGCVNDPAPDREPRAAAATGVVREFDFYLAFDNDLEIGGRHPMTLRFTTDPSGTGGSIPGPEIRVRQGDTVRLHLHDGHHTIHWHGVRLPWGMDGVPGHTQALGPGTFTYEFVALDAGTFWYHCHVDAPSHVDWGMFGALIVEPANPAEDPPFTREATLFLHEFDTRAYVLLDTAEGDERALESRPYSPWDYGEFARSNAVTLTETALFAAGGAGVDPAWGFVRGYHPRYDLFMINGKQFPDTDPVPITMDETVRIRLINAGQLVHTMHLHGHRFLVTHKDGALLPAPYLADTIGLFPGERYDVYVKGDNPGSWDFHDHGGAWEVGAYAANDGVFPGGMMTTLLYEDWKMPEEVQGPSGTHGKPLRASGGHAPRAAHSGGPPTHAGHPAPTARDAGTTHPVGVVPLPLGIG